MQMMAKVALALTLCAGARVAAAEGGSDLTVQNAKLVHTEKPRDGFVDNAFSFDAAGGRLLYVNADASTMARLVVVDLAQKTHLFDVDISKVSRKPLRAEFALDGAHFLVWSLDEKSGKQRVALVDDKGKVVRHYGPATDIVRTNYDGTDAIVVYDRAAARQRRRKGKGGGAVTRHTVEVLGLANGKRLGQKTSLDVDADGKTPELDFALKYWAKDYTVAVGIKGGTWDRKEDQRSPDLEGWYVMPTRVFSKRLPIADIVAHRERMLRLAEHAKVARTIVVRHNLSGIDYVEDGNFKAIDLDEPFHHYDSSSLVVQTDREGSLFFTLTIDPVNPDAAARKRAVKGWMDLYELPAGATKAVRRARLLPEGSRRYAWRTNGRQWVVMPRHIGFDRGGPELLIYDLK